MRNRITTILTITFAVVLLSVTSSLAGSRDRDRDRGRGETIRCESVGEKAEYCPTDSIGKVELTKQLSRSPCKQYDSWGSDRDGGGIWVRNGCRADFVVREQRGWGWGRGRNRDRDRDRDDYRDRDRAQVTTLKCKSKDWGYNHCDSPGRIRDSRVAKQISETRCVKGDNWDTDPSGLWVDRGCAAEFEVKVR